MKATLPAALAIVLGTLITGCAGASFKVPQDPLALLGTEAAMYAFLPVGPNRPFLDAVASSAAALSEKDRESLGGILDRSEVIRAALYADGSVRLVVSGSFPRAAAAFAFPESRGWKRVKASGRTWHDNGTFAAAIPAEGLLCVASSQSMADMLISADALPPPVSPSFAELSRTLPRSGQGALYLADSKAVLPLVFGEDISLPLETAECLASPLDGGRLYDLSFSLQGADEKRARALASLLRILSGSQAEASGQYVTLSLGGVTAETLAGFVRFLVP